MTCDRLKKIKEILNYLDVLQEWCDGEQDILLNISLEVENYIITNEVYIRRISLYDKEIKRFANHKDIMYMYSHPNWIKYLYFILFGSKTPEYIKHNFESILKELQWNEKYNSKKFEKQLRHFIKKEPYFYSFEKLDKIKIKEFLCDYNLEENIALL